MPKIVWHIHCKTYTIVMLFYDLHCFSWKYCNYVILLNRISESNCVTIDSYDTPCLPDRNSLKFNEKHENSYWFQENSLFCMKVIDFYSFCKPTTQISMVSQYRFLTCLLKAIDSIRKCNENHVIFLWFSIGNWRFLWKS